MNEGSCLCGNIRWQVDGDPQMLMNCYCSICRKIHGTDVVRFGAWPGDAFSWIAGDERALAYASSPGPAMRRYCPDCGSAVATLMPDGSMAFMAVGSLSGPLQKPLDFHAFFDSRAPWTREPGNEAPVHAGSPPGYESPEPKTDTREPTTEGAIGGSCHCGAVRFEFDKPFERMGHCHCSLCRRATSAAMSSELFVAREDFRWTRGEDKLVFFLLPDTHFGTQFCSECSSRMPHFLEGEGLWLVPAGGLDQDPGLRPMAHIFVGSKAGWDVITDDLPQFDEYPPVEGP